MDFLKYSKIYFLFSGILIFTSLFFILKGGLSLGIEFTGGTLFQVEFKTDFDFLKIQQKINEILGENFILQRVGERGILLKTKEFSDKNQNKILQALKEIGKIDEKSLEIRSIEPMIGGELKKSASLALVLAFIFILFYIAFAFRKVGFKKQSFKYGFAGLTALFHDVIISLGAFAFISLISLLKGFEVGIPFIVGMLTIVGYSINDTIVIFDRLRENILKKQELSKEVFNLSLNQSLIRSLFTSLTTLFVLLALLFWGSESLLPFVFVLIFGVIFGTYSSIFIASPILYRLMQK